MFYCLLPLPSLRLPFEHCQSLGAVTGDRVFCSVTFRTEINWGIYRESWVSSVKHTQHTHINVRLLTSLDVFFFHLSLSTDVWVWTFPQKCAILNVSLIFFALVSWLFTEDDLVDYVFFLSVFFSPPAHLRVQWPVLLSPGTESTLPPEALMSR